MQESHVLKMSEPEQPDKDATSGDKVDIEEEPEPDATTSADEVDIKEQPDTSGDEVGIEEENWNKYLREKEAQRRKGEFDKKKMILNNIRTKDLNSFFYFDNQIGSGDLYVNSKNKAINDHIMLTMLFSGAEDEEKNPDKLEKLYGEDKYTYPVEIKSKYKEEVEKIYNKNKELYSECVIEFVTRQDFQRIKSFNVYWLEFKIKNGEKIGLYIAQKKRGGELYVDGYAESLPNNVKEQISINDIILEVRIYDEDEETLESFAVYDKDNFTMTMRREEFQKRFKNMINEHKNLTIEILFGKRNYLKKRRYLEEERQKKKQKKRKVETETLEVIDLTLKYIKFRF